MAATIVAGSLREAMAAAMEACCCGSGSGSGGVFCANGNCINLTVPSTLTLSVNAIQLSTLLGDPPYSDNLARFVGDFTLTYLENEVLIRDVVDPTCEDINVVTGSLWFSDWIDATDFSPPVYWRYCYDACSGILNFQYKALDGVGCYLDPGWPPKEDYYVRLDEPIIETLTISDCTNYFSSAATATFTGSIAA